MARVLQKTIKETPDLALESNKLTTASGLAPSYAARAWVNFNGTGTVAIRGSGNVSSITDLGGTGQYRVNFATAMDDTNYAVVSTGERNTANAFNMNTGVAQNSRNVNYVDIQCGQTPAATTEDALGVFVAIFR